MARSFIPGSRCAVDRTMEETFMKHAKSKGGAGGVGAGLTGITTNYAAYQRWIKTMHERCKYLKSTFCLAKLENYSNLTKHRSLMRGEVNKSE